MKMNIVKIRDAHIENGIWIGSFPTIIPFSFTLIVLVILVKPTPSENPGGVGFTSITNTISVKLNGIIVGKDPIQIRCQCVRLVFSQCSFSFKV